MMNRKRGDFDYFDHKVDGLGPMTKKIKSPLANVDELYLKNNSSIYGNKFDIHEQNDHGKLSIISNLPIQTSTNTCHNRKRRPRITQDIYESNKSNDTLIPYSTASTSSQGRKKSELSCVVCNGLAHGYNFDAISCESCKAFFRRNALFNTDRLKCRRDGTCEITLETRRRCKSCRLKKCFAVGMRKEWILTEEEKEKKKRRIEENRQLRLNHINEMKESDDSDVKSDFELQDAVLNKEKNSVNNCQTLASKIDLINDVVTAFNDGFKLDPTSYGWSYPLAKKITALCQILNTKNTTALRLISFYKRLPEFDALNEIDKVNLIKSNLPYIFIFLASLGYDPNKDIYHEGMSSNDCIYYGSDILEAHGCDIHRRCTLIMSSLHSIVQKDQRIIQLALIIFLFSKGLAAMSNMSEPLLTNARQVYQAQNLYLEHLWSFMDKSFGSVHVITIFSTLIFQCLLTQNLLCDIQQDLHEKVHPYQVPPIIRTLMHLS